MLEKKYHLILVEKKYIYLVKVLSFVSKHLHLTMSDFFLTLLNPNRDQHLISPHRNTAKSFTKIMRMMEMITNLEALYC